MYLCILMTLFLLFVKPSSRNATSVVPGTFTPLSGSSSRRGSGDASSLLDPDASLSELRDIYDLKDQIQDVEGRYMQGLKDLKDSLAEVEEKYKKAMVSNAQLDNEKSNLVYQVDTLKDVIEEMEEQMAEYHRENEDKSRDLERQKHACSILQHKLDELKEGIRQRDELIEEIQRQQQKVDSLTREVYDLQETVNWKDKKIAALERQKEYFDCIRNERDELRDELADVKGQIKIGEKHGMVIIPDGTPNGDINHEPVVGQITVVSQEAAQVLESAGEGPLVDDFSNGNGFISDVRLRKLAEEKDELVSQIRKLKLQLDEERHKNVRNDTLTDSTGLENGSDLQLIEMQTSTGGEQRSRAQRWRTDSGRPLHIKRRCSDTDNDPDRCNVAVWSLESCHTDRSPATNDAALRSASLLSSCTGCEPESRAVTSPLCFPAHSQYRRSAEHSAGGQTARLQYKSLTMTYKAIHNLSPPYICDLVSRYFPTRNLRSLQDLLLYFPLNSSSHNRIQDFSRASPLLWNSLPQHIRLSSTIETFEKNLKTYLFRQAYNLQ
ncbi:unnamed protein product [Ranitomeya imitator]|uniref:Leucine-rich repeat flightless-interacting protein 2 n=1 Tax=Ranitomeya imitator TaxID=111125 RepID=A0ABN9LHP7_9NEOB|nr:unnamed protein product [Ranitomeya imitator]